MRTGGMALLRIASLVVFATLVLSSGAFAQELTAQQLTTTERTDEPALEAAVPACKTELASRLRALNVPGLSVGIIKNGRLACASSAGMANIEQKKSVSPDTVFA